MVAHLHNTTVEAFTGSVTISFEDASGGPAGHASLNVESLAPEGTAVQIVWADRTAARESSYSEGKLTTVALSNGGTILPLSRIAGKSFRQAKAVLGAPVTIHDDVLNNGWPVKTVTWAQHGIEIEFVQGKAQWITINDPSPWNFDSFGLQALGLPESQDNDSGPAAKRWSNTNGCQEITAFLGGASRDISYVYIVVSLDPTGF